MRQSKNKIVVKNKGEKLLEFFKTPLNWKIISLSMGVNFFLFV